MPRKRRAPASPVSFHLRVGLFVALAFALITGAIYALQPTTLVTADSAPVDVTLRIDMAGFTPPDLQLPAGRPVRMRIVNPDNSHHSDGGGVHGFTVAGLGIDVRIQPETTKVVTIPATAAGDYAFYCDTCCGGKENPAMQGVLKIRA